MYMYISSSQFRSRLSVVVIVAGFKMYHTNPTAVSSLLGGRSGSDTNLGHVRCRVVFLGWP